MDLKYKHQFRLLRDKYRESRDCKGTAPIFNMNGTFGDSLLLRNCADGSMSEWSASLGQQATTTSDITPSMSIASSPPDVENLIKFPVLPVREKHAPATSSLVSQDPPMSQSSPTIARQSELVRPRIGHKKSRAGCFNCKKRKIKVCGAQSNAASTCPTHDIKCQENQPACHNCTRKNLKCIYPAPRTMTALRDSVMYSPNPVASVNLQVTPQIFTLTDMRLFHHFLLDACPHLPVGNDSAWLTHIPLIAHHNEYLMHGILALAASNLQMLTPSPLSATAMYHRTLAIRGTNEAMSKPNRTGSDGDALLASCYLLTFQSTYMEDGIQEFFVFVRGCSLVASQLKAEKLPTVFLFHEGEHFNFMEERLQGLPIISPELIDGAEKSLLSLPPLFSSPVHEKTWHLLISCIHGVRNSSLIGYFTFIMIYGGIIDFSNEEFHDFADACNDISRIMIGHFLALQMVLFPILDREWVGKSKLTPARMNITWVLSIREAVSPSLRHLLEWPKAIMEAVQDELRGKESIIPRMEVLRKKEGLSKHIV